MSEINTFRPLVAQWNYTYECNLECKHCYSRDAAQSKEMTTEQAFKCVDILKDSGILLMNLGGGEPLLRSDVFEVGKYAHSKGINVALSTNGSLFTEIVVKNIVSSKISVVEISIDSAIPEVHDEFRRCKGLHQKAIHAIELAKSNGLEVHIATVITRHNHNNIEEMFKLARNINVTNVDLHEFVDTANSGLDLTPSEWKKFYEELESLYNKYDDININYNDPLIGLVHGKKQGRLYTGCMCGKLSLCIRPNGDLTPCVFQYIVAGNIFEDDLIHVWYNSEYFKQMRNHVITNECTECSSSEVCGYGGCPSRSLLSSNDVNAPDPHCWIAENIRNTNICKRND